MFAFGETIRPEGRESSLSGMGRCLVSGLLWVRILGHWRDVRFLVTSPYALMARSLRAERTLGLNEISQDERDKILRSILLRVNSTSVV